MSKKQLIRKLADDHKAGMKMKDILRDNPGVSKSTIYHTIRQDNKTQSQPEQVEQIEHQETQQEQPIKQETTPQPPTMTIKKASITRPKAQPIKKVDSFLGGFQSNDRFTWEQEQKFDREFGNFFNDVGGKSEYDPRKLANIPEPTQEKPTGKSWSFWKPKQKTKKELEKEEMFQEEDEKLKLVQSIRLYFHHFEFLKDLHIVPEDKKTGEKDVEKYLISLYNKKPMELEKTLHFIKWHTRNNISESSNKIFENITGTVIKTSEHLMIMLGLKVQGLTERCMNDEDIQRCIKEIQIEHGISTFSYGPKTDLAINICSTIARIDGENRIQEAIAKKQLQEEKKALNQVKKLEVMAKTDIHEKYKDL